MHGLRQIADSCSTHGHVLDQAQQTHTVLGRNGSNALEVLLDVRLELRVAVISLGRLGYHQAACQILCQTSNLVREAGNVLLADVSQQQVDQVVACLGLGALRGASDTAAVQGLVQVGHLDQLVLNVGSLGGASHLASQSGSADQNVAYADLAAAVRLTVIACETLYDHAGKLNFAVEEDAVVRNEYAVEDNENFVAAVYLVANVDVVVLDDTEIEAYRGKSQKPEFIEFNPQFTFDNFVVGSSNRFAHAAAVSVANNPAETYNPLFIYGPSGLGKTHLLYAIASVVHKNHPSYNIVYIKGDQFTNELIAALQEGRNNEFRYKYRNADLFLVDDIQFIAGKESTQEEFFHTFNNLYENHHQIVLTADRPPNEMLRLEDRLKTRFEWGLIADIQPPDYETRMAILRKNAEACNKPVDDEIFKYIATNIKSNIRELEGAFNRIIAKSKIENQSEITMELAEDALKDIINPDKPKEITPELIIEVVAEHFGVSPEDITSKKRNSEFVQPRQVVMYLCRKLTDTSYVNIGKLLGKKDHTTIIHGVNKIEDELKNNDELASKVETIKKKICV